MRRNVAKRVRGMHWSCVSGALALVLAAGLASAQPIFSIDYQGVPKGWMAGPPFPIPITEGDLLMPVPFPPGVPWPMPAPSPPAVYMSGGVMPGIFPGLNLLKYPAAVNLPAGIPGQVEVDALSFGTDLMLTPVLPPPNVLWSFSVDEFSGGIPGTFVFSQVVGATTDAAADLFISNVPGPGPMCGAAFGTNMPFIDGNAVPPGAVFGIALVEPTAAVLGPFKPGSNLDAADVDTPAMGPPPAMVFYSLDGPFPDPADTAPNTGSAIANGFGSGSAVVMSLPGVPGVVYIAPWQLGLDSVGPALDDLDALVYRDNGDGLYTPPVAPYSWTAGTDMVFFSVRRGSSVVNMLSSGPIGCPGLPIEPGDILVPGFPTPGVWITAEQLGLRTLRSGFGAADDLDALDVSYDCNANLMPDVLDITMNGMPDCDRNWVPDMCQPDGDMDTVIDPCDNCPATFNPRQVDTDQDGNGNACDRCPPDTNGSNTLEVQDIFDFLNLWFAGNGRADFDESGALAVQDVFSYLNAWFAGCP